MDQENQAGRDSCSGGGRVKDSVGITFINDEYEGNPALSYFIIRRYTMALRQTKIKTGIVQGVPCTNEEITVFRGIPYGDTTAGKNRFRPPQPPKPWEGVRLCDTFSEIAMQKSGPVGLPFTDFFRKEFYSETQTCGEDCLKLNVWTPAADCSEKLPVMFWIHGGGLGSGYGHEPEFDGEALCSEGVVLVTINYRLNYFGFFAHPDLSAESENGVSGNYGILDQIAALKWVHDNITAFGGNPENVTIFGQSAGGGSVVSHLSTSVTDGLFHKAIIQSGSFGVMSYAMTNTLEDAQQWGVKALELIGKSIQELREMPLEELYDAFETVSRQIGPVPKQTIDHVLYNEAPGMALLKGKLKNVPIITGAVKGDTSLRLTSNIEWLKDLPGEDILVLGDGAIACRQAEVGKIPTYVYFFDPYIPGGDEFHFIKEGEAYHSAELWYVFGTLNRCWRPFDERHYRLSRTMIKYWTNFAKTGNPNGEGLPLWFPVTGDSQMKLYMSEEQIKPVPIYHMELLKEKLKGNEW